MDEPLVTVIMPVRNEERFIALSLGAVLNQHYSASQMEIVVADGESDDATQTIIASLPGAECVRVIANPGRTQAAGMNAALAVAHGEIIVRVDGHTVIAPDYVAACVAELRRTGAHNAGGAMNPIGVTDEGKAIAAACKSPFAVPTAFHVSETGQFTDTVYLGAWPRWVFERVGGFDVGMVLNEDYELNYRIRQAGGRVYLSSQIHSHYFGRQTLGALARQYFRYGRAKVATLRKSPASVRPRQFVAPAFAAALAAAIPLALASLTLRQPWLAGAWAAWGALVLAYVALNLTFAGAAARRAGRALFWRVPPAFATIHLAWGAGFWVGLLAGPVRRYVGERRGLPAPRTEPRTEPRMEPRMEPLAARVEAEVAGETR